MSLFHDENISPDGSAAGTNPYAVIAAFILSLSWGGIAGVAALVDNAAKNHDMGKRSIARERERTTLEVRLGEILRFRETSVE